MLLFLVERLECNVAVTYVTDNLNVFETFHKGEEAALKSTNCDLFKLIFQLLKTRGISVTVRWMPSHLKPSDPRPAGVTEVDIIGNNFADVKAGVAAKRLMVPLNVSTPCLYYYSLVRRIQKRLIDIVTHLPHRVKTPRPKPIPHIRESLEDISRTSQHVVIFNAIRVTCIVCMCSLPVKSNTTKLWLGTSCNPVKQSNGVPVKLHNCIIQIGYISTHLSRDLHVLGGTIFCNKCGSHANNKIVNLGGVCCPATYGKAQLRAIRSGKIPKSFTTCNRYSIAHPGTALLVDPLDDPALTNFRQQFEAIRALGSSPQVLTPAKRPRAPSHSVDSDSSD